MCLTTGLLPRVHTAKEDMVVYKYGIILRGSRINHYNFESPLHNFVYGQNIIYKTEFKITKFGFQYNIHDGFHAYIKENTCVKDTTLRTNGIFVIPKGSKYYLGIHGDIVSNQIIFKELKNMQ